MPITTESINQVFKTVYLPMVSEQINVSLAAVAQKIESTTTDIETTGTVVKCVPYGLNGGTGSINENDPLPMSGSNKRENFRSELKTLAGTLEITDKAWKSSISNVAAFENLLTSNMDGLKKSCQFSAGRQYYGDGTGELTRCGTTTDSLTVEVASTQYLVEGMIVDLITNSTGAEITNGSKRRIKSIDRANKTITLEGTATVTTASTVSVYEQGSKDKEMTGLGKVFAKVGSLYGLEKASYSWLVPQLFENVGTLTSRKFVTAMRQVRDYAGGNVDFIATAPAVYEEYYEYLETMQRQVNVVDLQGGFKSLSVNGIPLTSDRFIKDGEAHGLTSNEWKLHQLDDWNWMEDDKGAIITLIKGYAKYTASLIKYAELICDHPGANFKMSGITVTGG
ncbi:hypothetical protein Cpap_1528 [Ruminiclostridium papyrosolvens DSM 2782]|uniref:Phage major capsid protein, HK97 family n=1 Tax=Ruminiclostridium papyrosolvens DSM 2782 TaxID=588581 RepID=F1TEH0_9FIRM|nr:phage major capsid protein [Ruminiclostridium papyrosolvens]EGD47136.1 hypothetical protein Cpap_1528 [Ruminiclostridium papyrosolvens DSM 2782]WES36078.1 phage major capsid protein [Ruminiclostridium papyrosolvens DSM 2782]WES36176.1 phage major capsid protein [Ruminiclostridium papyrosolvens DSM 2782]